MKKLLISAVLLVIIMLVGCAAPMDEPMEPTEPVEPVEPVEPTEPMEPEAPAEGEIQIVGSEFVPASITVKVGGTVTWTNMDEMKHLVSSNKPYIKSDVLEKDGVFSYTFEKAGSFSYVCALHPGTRGQVIVEE